MRGKRCDVLKESGIGELCQYTWIYTLIVALVIGNALLYLCY